MKNNMKQIVTIALLLIVSATAWAGDITQGTVSNATITFSTTQDGTYSATLAGVSAETKVYMRVEPSTGYYITTEGITLTKGKDVGSAQARRRSITRAPEMDVNVTFSGADPADLSSERIYEFDMPANDADVIVDASATSRNSIAGAVVTAKGKTYNGEQQTADAAEITVKLGDATLVQGTDYEVTTNQGGTNVGNYDIVVTGKSTYTETATGSGAFAITKASVSQIAITGIDAPVKGNAFDAEGTPSEGITINSIAWFEGDAAAPENAAANKAYTVKITVSADANHSIAESVTATINGEEATFSEGAVTYTFTNTAKETLTAESLNSKTSLNTTEIVFTGGGVAPTVTITDMTEDTDFTVKYKGDADATTDKPINVGTYTIVIAGKGDFAGEVVTDKTFAITPKNLSEATVTVGAKIWTGSPQTAEESSVTVKFGDGDPLELTTDYTVTVNGGTDVGEYTVTVEGTGNYTGTKDGTFKIVNPTTDLGNGLTYEYDPVTNTVTIKKTGEGSGAMDNFTEENPAPWKDLVKGNTTVIIEDGVTSIGENAFTGTPVPATIFAPTDITVSDNAVSGDTDLFKYTEDTDGKVTITGYTGNSDPVAIPSTIGDTPVTAIGNGAFTGDDAPKTVLIPDGTNVGENAFDNEKTDQFTYREQKDETSGETTGLTITGYKGNSDPVEIPSSVGGTDVNEIVDGAFTGDDAPKTVLIPDGTTVGKDAFGDNTSQLTYKEEDGGVTITGYKGDENDVVEIPGTIGGIEVKKIDDGAFTGENTSPKTVLIPDGTNIEENAFDDDKTGRLTYEESTSETGEKTIEITGYEGNGTSVEIPAEIGGKPVTDIAVDAFKDTNIEQVTVPETVTADTSDGNIGGISAEVTHDLGGGIIMKSKVSNSSKLLTVTETGTTAEYKNAQRLPYSAADVTLVYNRTLAGDATDQLYTVCLPYTPPTSDNLKYYSLSTGENNLLKFTLVTTPSANTPYLVSASADVNISTTEGVNANLSAAITPTGDVTVTDGYQLCGTLRGMTHEEAVAAGAYILQDDRTWKKVTNTLDDNLNAYIPPFRAYVVKVDGGSSGARLFSETEDYQETGITSNKSNSNSNTEWYTLDGRKLDGKPTQKGIYVCGNEKFVIK